ncbi:UNVERIFIED_CONTAM: hypothetical protein Sradi_1301800 [Sesamum radiatum]|uniref:Uncharacterized protein n=1 Tax=Sesamum radiatum TaxID=300843 RepID=A0AAW2UPQ3_SESRA
MRILLYTTSPSTIGSLSSPSGTGESVGGWAAKGSSQMGSIGRIHSLSFTTQTSRSGRGSYGGNGDGAVDPLAPDGPTTMWWVSEPKLKTWPLFRSPAADSYTCCSFGATES